MIEKKKLTCYYTFAVELTETVTIAAKGEDEARRVLERGLMKYAQLSRDVDLDDQPRILKQKIEQREIRGPLSVENPMDAIIAEERERYGDMPSPLEVGKALEERWQKLVARVEALEKQVGQS